MKNNLYITPQIQCYLFIKLALILQLNDDDDDDDIEFISTKIGSCRPLRSCGKKIIIK